jgi:hypothetical protein
LSKVNSKGRFKSTGERALAFAMSKNMEGVRPGENLQSASFVLVHNHDESVGKVIAHNHDESIGSFVPQHTRERSPEHAPNFIFQRHIIDSKLKS